MTAARDPDLIERLRDRVNNAHGSISLISDINQAAAEIEALRAERDELRRAREQLTELLHIAHERVAEYEICTDAGAEHRKRVLAEKRLAAAERDAGRWRWWRTAWAKSLCVPSVVLGRNDADQLDDMADAGIAAIDAALKGDQP